MTHKPLEELGLSESEAARLLASADETQASQQPLLKWRKKLQGAPGEFERMLFTQVAAQYESAIDSLPVHPAVKNLLRDEFQFYSKPQLQPIELGSYPFVIAAKTLTLRRFPAGPMDWEISGFPRSWLLHVRKAELPRILRALAFDTHGFAPMFVMHVARKPKNRTLVLEHEVMRCQYRVARSLELQPQVKGITVRAWFHDPQTVRDNPHLDALNRVYREAGATIVIAGLAPADGGFLDNRAVRKKRYERGALRYSAGIVLWPRKAAIDWALRRSDLDR
jgi:hypothetical protein